jgi:hypothetical protein
MRGGFLLHRFSKPVLQRCSLLVPGVRGTVNIKLLFQRIAYNPAGIWNYSGRVFLKEEKNRKI